MKIPRKKMTLSRLESTFWRVSSFISLDFDDANEFCETVVRVYKKDKINRNPDFHASSLHPPVEYVLFFIIFGKTRFGIKNIFTFFFENFIVLKSAFSTLLENGGNLANF
jgi:hypothetical protein